MTALALPSRHEEAWRWSDLSALPALAERAPTGALPEPARFAAEGGQSMPRQKPAPSAEIKVRKPSGHSGH